MTLTVCTSRFVTYTLGILMYAGHSSSKSTDMPVFQSLTLTWKFFDQGLTKTSVNPPYTPRQRLQVAYSSMCSAASHTVSRAAHKPLVLHEE